MESETVTQADDDLADERERWIADVVQRERPRLETWLRRHAPSAEDVEDLLQEAFSELVVAYQVTQPIQHAGAWLYRIVRNRLTDLFRKHTTQSLEQMGAAGRLVEELMPDPSASPEQSLAWQTMVLELEGVLAELPAEQRDIFIAHEIDGRSFEEIAALTGESVKKLASRKHSAITALRRRLQISYDQLSEP